MDTDLCEFKINGDTVPDEPRHLRRLIKYLNKRVEWMTSAPRYSEIDFEDTLEPPPVPETPTVKPNPIYNPSPGRRIIDYIMRALYEVGGTATAQTVCETATRLGWTTTAKIPVENLKTIAREKKYRDLVTLNDNILTLSQQGKQTVRQLFQDNPDLVSDDNSSEHRPRDEPDPPKPESPLLLPTNRDSSETVETPDAMEEQEEDTEGVCASDEVSIRQLVRSWIASQNEFTGQQLIDAIQQYKPDTKAFTIQAELTRCKQEGIVAQIRQNRYRAMDGENGVADQNGQRRGSNWRFVSVGRSQHECVLLAMGMLDRPATPREVVCFLQDHPKIDFHTHAEHPHLHIRKLMREDKQRYEPVQEGTTWQLTQKGRGDFQRLYLPIEEELREVQAIGLFDTMPIQN